MNNKGTEKLAEAINKNRLLQAGVLVLGLAFTVSAIYNHYYTIRLNKIRIQKESKS